MKPFLHQRQKLYSEVVILITLYSRRKFFHLEIIFRRIQQNFEKRLLASSCSSVCLSVRMKQLGCHCTDLQENCYLGIFRRSVERTHIWLKSDKKNWYFAWRNKHLWLYLDQLFLDEKLCGQTSKQNQNRHLIFNNFSFSLENHVVYETMWKNTVQPGRPHMTTWLMRTACWIPKATNTHSEYVIFIAFPLQQWLHARPSILRLYVHCLTCSKEEEDHRLESLIRLQIPYCSSLCYASETVELKESTKVKKNINNWKKDTEKNIRTYKGQTEMAHGELKQVMN